MEMRFCSMSPASEFQLNGDRVQDARFRSIKHLIFFLVWDLVYCKAALRIKGAMSPYMPSF